MLILTAGRLAAGRRRRSKLLSIIELRPQMGDDFKLKRYSTVTPQDPKPRHTAGPEAQAPSQTPTPVVSSRLIHELANLLDGCQRHIGLVMAQLKRHSGHDMTPQSLDEQNILTRLLTANQAMNQMITLIERSRDPSLTGVDHHLRSPSQTLGQVFDLATQLTVPEDRFEITVDLPDTVRQLPAGPLYPVIANAVRNSVEAVVGWPPTEGEPGGVGRIQLVGRHHDTQIELTVIDNGPGFAPSLFDDTGQFIFGCSTKAQGRGLGLALSRDIVKGLDGTIELTNHPHGGGACLMIRYPIVGMIDRA